MAIMSSADFPFINKRYWSEFDIFNIANIPYGPMDFAQYSQCVPLIPQNCILIVGDAEERGTSMLYKSQVVNPVDNVPVYDVYLLENTTTLSTRCRCGLRGRILVWNAKKYLITRVRTSVNQNTLVTCVRQRLACTSHPTQDYVNNVLAYFGIVPISRITNKTRYAHAQHNVKSVVTGLPDRSPITFANHYFALTVTR